ncbi:hydroxycarboxylic acid receptor 2-like [Sebastes umbrosus]|uniref:hydroxycarboxylic acid receptor 2-like n=1 Tax=Sebastes umbrosus TaxID=72105 RepID=UPI0018A0D34B|nr:hydroxycarboxylic acid receptor 2-like [Sebastes umbrosus]
MVSDRSENSTFKLDGVYLPPVLAIDVILGLLANVVALWIFCFKLKVWNPNNLFLFNLVIADFLALVSLPQRIASLLKGYWEFGDVWCRINFFLMFSNRSASIAFMTVVAIYRYFRVVHPHHRFNRMTKRHAAFVSVFVWLLVIIPRVPMLAYNHIRGSGNTTQCYFTNYKEASQATIILVGFHRVLTVLEFFIAMAMLLFFSIQISSVLKQRQMGKPVKVRKAMLMCVAITGVFMVCFLPSTVATIALWVIRAYTTRNGASYYKLIQVTLSLSLSLNFLNSALDPIVYVFSSSMFRKALCSSLPRALRCRQDAGNGENAASLSRTQSTTQQELKSMMADRKSEAM